MFCRWQVHQNSVGALKLTWLQNIFLVCSVKIRLVFWNVLMSWNHMTLDGNPSINCLYALRKAILKFFFLLDLFKFFIFLKCNVEASSLKLIHAINKFGYAIPPFKVINKNTSNMGNERRTRLNWMLDICCLSSLPHQGGFTQITTPKTVFGFGHHVMALLWKTRGCGLSPLIFL